MVCREGDYLEAAGRLIFAVKGIVHPPNYIISFPKYYPSSRGMRRRGHKRYGKITALQSFYDFLRRKYPEYLRYDPVFNDFLGEVPHTKVTRYFRPEKSLQGLMKKRGQDLDVVERDVVDFAELLVERSGMSEKNIGVSGSVMLGLHTKSSDIDLVVYGEKPCRLAYDALNRLTQDSSSSVKPYDEAGLKKLHRLRFKDTRISQKDFLKVERKKILQGKFRSRDYFIRLVKEPMETSESYGQATYIPVNYVSVEAEVADNREAIFTPCRYPVRKVVLFNGVVRDDLKEVVSFRGRFCEHVKRHERVLVRGKLEKVRSIDKDYFRVVVGNRPEDFIMPMESR